MCGCVCVGVCVWGGGGGGGGHNFPLSCEVEMVSKRKSAPASKNCLRYFFYSFFLQSIISYRVVKSDSDLSR